MFMVTMKELLEAGAHFGHQKSAWNPKMEPYIYQRRNRMHIIDLRKTIRMMDEAYQFVRDLTSEEGKILFVGTKHQARRVIGEQAKRCISPYVNNRWIGGFLTNFSTVKKRIEKLVQLEKEEKEKRWEILPKKEEMSLRKEMEKLRRNFNGVREMDGLPESIFVTDLRVEETAIKEARKLNIPIVGIVDSNCDPTLVDHLIPANDDAIKSIELITTKIADAVLEGREIFNKKKEQAEEEGEDEEAIEMREELEVAAKEDKEVIKDREAEKEMEE
ncbi:MAG: 30S ribosomal protein S2 [Candidatus Aerophobetes bacterium]|nr:30S ribosomal protein S2 [Candidatus Aerophobetes bacterium]